jgi:hypothetical protein
VALRINAIVQRALTSGVPAGTYVTSTPDARRATRKPYIVHSAITGTRPGNGDATHGQIWTVPVSVVAATNSDASELAWAVHDVFDAAPANGHLDPGPGRIAHMDVVSLPTRARTSTDPAEHVHQYDATYRLVIAD